MPNKIPVSKKRFALIFTLILGALVLYLLSYLYHSSSPRPEYAGLGGVTYEYDMAAQNRGEDASQPSKVAPQPDGQRQFVIKSAGLDITVRDLDESTEKVREHAKEIGGTVENLRDTGKDRDRVVVMTIRIPSASFDATVKKLKDLSVDVLSTSEDTSDITQAYIDLEARLKSSRALEEQLIAILARATTVEDTLAVQEQLARVRSEIESMQAQMNYYDSQVSMSTITVSMNTSSETAGILGDAWRPVGVFREALSSLVDVLKGIGSLIIWVGVFSPVLLLVYWVISKGVRRK